MPPQGEPGGFTWAALATCPTSRGQASLLGMDAADLEGEVPTAAVVAACGWRQELDDIDEYLRSYGDRAPADLLEELQRVRNTL